MSGQNPNRRSNSSEDHKKLLATRELENKNQYFKSELKRYGCSPNYSSSFTAVDKDNETAPLFKTINATKEDKEELQTSNKIHQSGRQTISQPPDVKYLVVWSNSKSQKSRLSNTRQLMKREKKPQKVDKKFTKETANCQEKDGDGQVTSIIQAVRERDYTSISLPLWIPSCL